MIGFRCECGAAIDCTYPKCKEGIETSDKDITERLQGYARDYTTTTYHDDLIREAVTGIESLRQQLADSQQALRNVYEVWAGSEHLPRATAAFDSYLLGVIAQMRDAAKEGLK